MSDESQKRCQWCENTFDDYIKYHDEDWGVPVHDDLIHFEFLILEGAQAGLSWSTVLKKRSGYREAFENFDPKKISRFSEKKILSLIENPAIIRNKAKIRSVVNNAQKFLEIRDEFGSFDKYIWEFVNEIPIVNEWSEMGQVPATSSESDLLSKDLIKRGFKFVGSTIMYAHMQACGLVNDHTKDCFRYEEILKAY